MATEMQMVRVENGRVTSLNGAELNQEEARRGVKLLKAGMHVKVGDTWADPRPDPNAPSVETQEEQQRGRDALDENKR